MMNSTMRMAAGLAGCVAVAILGVGAVGIAAADDDTAKVTLRDASGTARGTVWFADKHDQTEVRVRLDGVPAEIPQAAFHGFHIHGNGDPANGEGGVADPTKPSNTWFVTVDGHWKADGQNHAGHIGDMPSLLVTKDGRVETRFLTDRIDLSQLKGKAVIVHAGADNFGNVPVGTNDNQYTANKTDAVTATQNTGNAGDRVLCGVVGQR